MNKFIWLIFFYLTLLFCCSITIPRQINVPICSNFINGIKSCSTKLLGSFEIFNKEQICISLNINDTKIGVLKMRVKEIRYYPFNEFMYWTYGFEFNKVILPALSIRDTITDSILDICNNNRFDTACICYHRCKNDEGKLNRLCGFNFDVNTVKDFTYIGDSDCFLEEKPLFLHTKFYSSFYIISFPPIKKEIFQVWKLKSSSSFAQIDVEIEFEDQSGINKTSIEKQKLFPNNTQTLTFDNRQFEKKFGSFTFKSTIINTGFANFPISKVMTYVTFLENEGKSYLLNDGVVNEQNSFEDGKVGEIQADSIEDILNNCPDPVFSVIDDTRIIYSCKTVKASKNLYIKSFRQNYITSNVNIFNITTKKSSISFRNTNTRDYRELPSNAMGLKDFTLYDDFTNSQQRLFARYNGTFTFTMNFISDIDYRFIIEENEVCPEVQCINATGEKNSTFGSFLTIKVKSNCFNGLAKIDLSLNNEKDIQIYTGDNFFITNQFSIHVINFNINTESNTVKLKVNVLGNFGNLGNCDITYHPKYPPPPNSEFNTIGDTEGGIKCQFFFNCVSSNFPQNIFDFFNNLFNINDIFSILIKIGIVILVIGIIILIIYCIIQGISQQSITQNLNQTEMQNLPIQLTINV